jgi:hypothetical protein
MSDLRARARQLRENIEGVTRDLEKLGQQAGASGRGEDLTRLRERAARELQQTRDLIDQLRRQDPSFASGGTGFTFEGLGMTFSSPGTEAFKQDFAKWQTLRDQATRGLERAESSLSNRLQEKASSGRMAAGIEDKAPAAYQQQVDRYFKALGNRTQP